MNFCASGRQNAKGIGNLKFATAQSCGVFLFKKNELNMYLIVIKSPNFIFFL
jgi:hypothetical protein